MKDYVVHITIPVTRTFKIAAEASKRFKPTRTNLQSSLCCWPQVSTGLK